MTDSLDTGHPHCAKSKQKMSFPISLASCLDE